MQILLSIEALITNSLLPGSSFCKFVFGDDEGNFYYFSFEDDRFRVYTLLGEVWMKIAKLKPKRVQNDSHNSYEKFHDSIYVSHDIYNTSHLETKF